MKYNLGEECKIALNINTVRIFKKASWDWDNNMHIYRLILSYSYVLLSFYYRNFFLFYFYFETFFLFFLFHNFLSSIFDTNFEWQPCINYYLKPRQQCLNARKKANKMLVVIKRNVSYKSNELVTKLYNSFIRPHLEYCEQAWRPYHKGDILICWRVYNVGQQRSFPQ